MLNVNACNACHVSGPSCLNPLHDIWVVSLQRSLRDVTWWGTVHVWTCLRCQLQSFANMCNLQCEWSVQRCLRQCKGTSFPTACWQWPPRNRSLHCIQHDSVSSPMYKSQIPKPRTESDDLTQAKGLDFFPFQISFNQKPETWQARLPPLKFIVSPGPGAKQRPQQTPKLTNLEAEGPDVQKFQPNLKNCWERNHPEEGQSWRWVAIANQLCPCQAGCVVSRNCKSRRRFQALAVWRISSLKTQEKGSHEIVVCPPSTYLIISLQYVPSFAFLHVCKTKSEQLPWGMIAYRECGISLKSS